jgi:hypothetical protein
MHYRGVCPEEDVLEEGERGRQRWEEGEGGRQRSEDDRTIGLFMRIYAECICNLDSVHSACHGYCAHYCSDPLQGPLLSPTFTSGTMYSAKCIVYSV